MTVIIIFAAFALALGILEIFILPGFGVAGVSSIICAIIDVVLIYNEYGPVTATICTIAALVVLAATLWWVAHSKTLEKFSLHSTISSTNATEEQLSINVGDEGKALTRLALVGNATINGKQVEVKSSGAFINPGTPIRVTQVSEANITVEAIPNA